MAALTNDHKKITIAVVNPTKQNQKLNTHYKNINLNAQGVKWTISGNNLKAINQPGAPLSIKIINSAVNNADQLLSVDPLSVTIFELKIKNP
jgi:alpha-L-arabinofuranosidase